MHVCPMHVCPYAGTLDKTMMIALIQESTKTLAVGVANTEKLDRPGIVRDDRFGAVTCAGTPCAVTVCCDRVMVTV